MNRPLIPQADKIRALRRERGWTQEDLARLADLSMRTIHRIERGGPVHPRTLFLLARALGIDNMQSLCSSAKVPAPEYQSAFISYGGPDERFARRIYETLVSHKVNVFFFPESAVPGKRLHRTMSEAVLEYDRIILICSENSLNRRGVLNEIEQVLTREADEGGAELLIPVTLDDYLFSRWNPEKFDIAFQVRSRVVADFSEALDNDDVFEARLNRLLSALEMPA